MVRRVWPALALLAPAALAAGCGGLSTVEAEQRCDQARAADATDCVNDAAYDQCVSCFEECGDECAKAESCPAQFICPE
ncbi:MAG: hypothetical protein IT372_20020 [Polyangiaceae bacterium]|nr:hypothetical protein [Polyangiaceae bacterium]